MTSSLQRAVDGGMCIGCGACAVITPTKITLALGRDGFQTPLLGSALDAAEDALIEAVCPALNIHGPADYTPGVWGTVLRSAVSHATDEGIRHMGASGGALSAVVSHQIASGRASGAICIAASPGQPLLNEAVHVATSDSVATTAGSRYSPAAPLLAMINAPIAEAGVVFVGKPCDVAAARALAAEDLGHLPQVALYVSFLCAGTPSAHGTDEILKEMGVLPTDVLEFRYRGHGWPGRASATTADGAVEMDYSTSWGRYLGTTIHNRCKYCADGIGLSADLVFGDAWETDERGYPRFEERPGESLVLVRTKAGAAALEHAEHAGQVASADLPLGQVAEMQPYQVDRRRVIRWRLAGRRMAGRAVPRYGRSVGLRGLSAGLSTHRRFREMAGSLKRSLGRGAL